MQRKEAETLIGQRVKAWTAANGVYVGVLVAVGGARWRGTVLIDGVLDCAQHYERGQVCRRGFRPGETIEVGGVSIAPTQVPPGGTYLAALDAEIQKCIDGAANTHESSRSAWVWPAFEKAVRTVREAELRRLAGEPWRLHLR